MKTTISPGLITQDKLGSKLHKKDILYGVMTPEKNLFSIHTREYALMIWVVILLNGASCNTMHTQH